MSGGDTTNLTVCVGAVVLRGARILFVRQSPGHALGGQWSIPWGMVERGESPDAAVLREICEEAGVQARILGLLGIQNLDLPGWIGIVYLCEHLDGEPAPDGAETDRAAYLSRAEIETFDESFEPWCAWLARRALDGNCRPIPPEPLNPYAPLTAYL